MKADRDEPRDPAAVLDYINQWSAEVDKYAQVRNATNAHREAHGCDAYPTSSRRARLQSAVAQMIGARRILELGCALGYSALWYADALPAGGVVESIERDRTHADLAEENFRRQGVSSKVRVLRGEAGEILPSLSAPYDLVSVDSDWAEFSDLFPHFLRLLRPGGILASFNLFPGVHPVDFGLKEVAEYRRLLEEDLRLFTVYLADGLAISVRS